MEGEGGVAVRGVAILEVVQEGTTATHLEEEVALVASQGGWGGREGGREKGGREREREQGVVTYAPATACGSVCEQDQNQIKRSKGYFRQIKRS